MAYFFQPTRPTALKTEIYSRLKDIPAAVEFMNWSRFSRIISKDEGEIWFNPNTWYDSQWRTADVIFSNLGTIHWFNFLKGRQLGETTWLNNFDLYYNFKYPDLQFAMVSADYKISAEIRFKLQTIYNNLPLSNRRKKLNDNAMYMRFGNGSTIKHLFTTGIANKRGNMGRSGSHNSGHFTEVAFFQNLDDYNTFASALSDIYTNRIYIRESTANQFNHWYDMWEEGKESNTQINCFLGWWLKETNRIDDDRELIKYGYDPVQWEQESIDLVKKLYDYEITINQLAWWRKKCKEEMSDRGTLSREDIALQELPFTEHDAFRLSGKSFFKAKKLEEVERERFEPVRFLEPILMTKPEQTEFREKRGFDGNGGRAQAGKIKIWEEFEPGAQYILGADPSFGANPDSDNCALEIFKCFRDKIVQVVEYADNIVDTFHFTWILISLAGMWSAPQIVEVNGPGRTVLSLIDMYKRWIKENTVTDKMTVYQYAKKLKQEYLYHKPDSIGVGVVRQWMTSGNSISTTKGPLMFQFQSCFHNGEVVIHSKALAKEMEFVTQEGESIGAIENKHDDLVIASALVCEYWMKYFRTKLPTFEEYNEKKAQLTEEKKVYDDPQRAFTQNWVRGIIKNKAA